MRYWNGSQWKDHFDNVVREEEAQRAPVSHEVLDAIAMSGLPIDSSLPDEEKRAAIQKHFDEPYPDGIVFLGDPCDHCTERVRYWNTGAIGNAACGCTTEGPEVCEVIRPSHELEPEIKPSDEAFWKNDAES